jgi:hypothetical protein
MLKFGLETYGQVSNPAKKKSGGINKTLLEGKYCMFFKSIFIY